MRGLLAGTTCALVCVVASNMYGAEPRCPHVLDAAEVLKEARTLDGKIICVTGKLVPVNVPQWKSSLIYELFPAKGSGKGSSTRRLGVLEWSPETGIDEKYYKPDSFDLLAGSTPGASTPTTPLYVTIRGAVEYMKNLFGRLPPIGSSAPQTRAMRTARYEVELVVLEIISATPAR